MKVSFFANRRVTSYNGIQFSYDGQGRKLDHITNGNKIYNYRYDANGIRYEKTIDGVKTQYYLNGSQILAEVSGNT